MLENPSKMELSELGEFGLIDHLTKNIKLRNPSSVKGVGDDAAIIDYKDKQTVITTDMLVEGVHFNLSYVPLKHLGYKAIVVNLSDICAMHASPKQVTVSIAVSSKFGVDAVEELYQGIYIACEKYGIDLVGGDTTSSLSGLVISVTALGEVEADKAVFRNTAKEGDLIVVTGDLGGAYVGLQVLEREYSVFKENPKIQPDLEGHDYILERQLKPEARADIKGLLNALAVHPNSMIDISDGLASEILHLCNQSKVGCRLYEEKIPIDPVTYNTARDFNLDPTLCALSGGEDYELLFTIAQNDFDKIKANPNLTVIGHITDMASGINLVTKTNTLHPITAQGWDAFLKKNI
ncbi:MAG: thiamine-phosphate kinase [Bacteroidetes bacterium]|nr:thiamine-phosphate kinase [Bacteroidota bacterium]HET6245475.1 thiamine-phosphate kinase [Bacteroidia bacterium]